MRNQLSYFLFGLFSACLLLASSSVAQDPPMDRIDLIQDYFSSGLVRTNYSNDAQPAFRGHSVDFERYRTYDGSMNNLTHQNWGKAGSKLWRMSPQAYDDNRSVPSRSTYMSARAVSNIFSAQDGDEPNARQLRNMVWQWGQFLDHDLDHTDSHVPPEAMPIPVPVGDPYFDPFVTGQESISFFRSAYARRTGQMNPRQQINGITSWIDGSNVYGSNEATNSQLRTFENGELLCTDGTGGQFLPRDENGFFLSGDVRVNEQICLTCMHTLFMREHNRIARQIKQGFSRLDDETIFQLARKRVIAHMQAITYNEFLPALLGIDAIAPYEGYDESVYPAIANEFSTTAYRFGHTMLTDELMRLDNSGLPIPEGHVSLANAFFNPELLDGIGIDPYLKGLVTQQAQEIDGHLVNSVRNFLFGPPGAGGFDLAALNIQRGRDHGLPDFNTIRVTFGLPAVTSFAEITSDVDVQNNLQLVYTTVDNVDPWVGILVEDHAPGASVGITTLTVLKDQFERVRDADRFWYQREFSGAILEQIEQTTLADIIERNTGVRNLPTNVFTGQ